MTDISHDTIRFLGSTRPYADGAENAVLESLGAVADRSDGSDELRRCAVDWPTTYHFSPKRSNLLRPFDISPHDRVLEIGAGAGAVTRYLGELGASVVALEGDPDRARAVARRCADLDAVEVVCGPLDELDDAAGFDVVVIVGVLEYAGPCPPASGDQLAFLELASRLVRPDGVLLLAIENRLGLKYLLGSSEDHLGEPWAGVEGYPGRPATCTFSRRALRAMLDDAGLTARRWFYPFPDYKLPRVVLSGSAYELPDATTVVDNLVGRPVLDLAHPPTRYCDDRAAHLSFLEAGLGPDVANSFLVAAARSGATLDQRAERDALAWHFSSDRRRPLRRLQVVHRDAAGALRVSAQPVSPGSDHATPPWLRHHPNKDEAFFSGETVEQRLLGFARHNDLDGISGALDAWSRRLADREVAPPTNGDDNAPYAARENRPALPADHLDVSLSNFVDHDGRLEFVDREWLVAPAVDAALVRYRALWYAAVELVVGGSPHPFGADADIDTIAARLASLIRLDVTVDLSARFVRDEARIQEAVTGEPAARVEAQLRQLGATSRTDRSVASELPVSQLRRDLVELGSMLDRVTKELEAERAATEAELGTARAFQERLTADVERSVSQLDEAKAYQERLETELVTMREQIDEATAFRQRLEAELDARDRQLAETVAIGDRLASDLARLETWRADTVRRPLVRISLAVHRLIDRLIGRQR
ncbi:MAG: methyltransferase domain-containing protein [Holophagae bacterium]|jgi:SAM-dependent methyltransferase